MQTRRLFAALASTLLLSVATLPAMAETDADMSFDGMVMKRTDMNKDGMVSKKEFLDMMGKVWDERAKKATLKNGMMMFDDFQKMVVMYLKAGG